VIKYHDGETLVRVNPIRATKGMAVHSVVTIRDAIGDLPRFDWYGFFFVLICAFV
jgi:hypothetical protein